MTLWPIGSGDESSFNAFVTDITDRKRREEAVEHLAFHDRLTGLPNRAHLETQVGAALASVDAGRTGEAALLFLDIDRFKHVNDTMGHDAGDELLRQVAARLRKGARSHDVVARLAGDEFVVLLTDLPAPGAVRAAGQVAARIRAALAAPYTLPGGAFETKASVGVAVYPEDAADAASLFKTADERMYEQKRGGDGALRQPGEHADAA
jgi:diguanylate cyclase (GGDEF)-like protein